MKNLLYIAYYFPPLGMGGVQRALKFVKYLPQFGWTPTVLTVDDIPYYAYDTTLLDEIKEIRIHRVRSLDPVLGFGSRISRNTQASGTSLFAELYSRAGRMWVPDNKILWLPGAFRRAAALLNKGHFDAVLTTSPPHSVHLLGELLHQKTRIPWLADFRDNWFDDYYRHFPTCLHRKLNRHLANRVLNRADRIVAVSEPITQDIAKVTRRPIATIHNGYDPDDFIRPAVSDPDQFTVTYAGTLNKWLNPTNFFKGAVDALSRSPELRRDLRIEIIGRQVNFDVSEMVKKSDLSAVVDIKDYMPHKSLIQRLLASQMLLLLIPANLSEGMVTGKLFEYLAAHKPIFAIVPAGRAREMVLEHGRGVVINPDDIKGISAALIRAHELWKRGDLKLRRKRWHGLENYSRRVQTGKLAEILDDMSSGLK